MSNKRRKSRQPPSGKSCCGWNGSDRLLDLLFDDPTNQELLDELNRIDVDYIRLSGEKSMEY
ncbi:MAG: hypothetical protein ACLVI2_13220 [Parabacteroides merdae]